MSFEKKRDALPSDTPTGMSVDTQSEARGDHVPVLRGSILRWLNAHLAHRSVVGAGADPHGYDPVALAATLDRFRELGSWLPWFRRDARGFENVPRAPVLVVMNHSGGTSIPDVWGLILAWYAHFGTQRPLHPLAHEMVLGTPLTARYFERRGVLAADRRVAATALAAGHDVLVLPGGDLEAWRPYRDRFRVDFGGRTGYAKLAAEAQVPIVPIAHVGAHETLVVLSRGRRLARALRLPELTRAEIFPIHLSLPWGLAIGPLPHIPWPGTLRYRVARPVPPGAPPSPNWSDAEKARHTAAIDIQVRIAIQTELDRLKAELAKHPT